MTLWLLDTHRVSGRGGGGRGAGRRKAQIAWVSWSLGQVGVAGRGEQRRQSVMSPSVMRALKER